MGERKRKVLKILKNIGVCLIVLLLILYIGMPVGFGFYSTFQYKREVSEPPKDFTEITLNTSDGVKLAAWYKAPQNGAAIILLHGGTGTREGIQDYALMLVNHGYGVLAFDMRGHGESGGDGVNAYGWNSTEDIGAAVEYLMNQPEVISIGGLGISLGGEALLGAASTFQELRAIVSDGATYRTLEDYLILPSRRDMIRSFTTRLMFQAAQILGGVTPPLKISDSIAGAQDTSLFFIAAGEVEKEIEYNTEFLKVANSKSDLWIVNGVEHTDAFHIYPEEYEERLIQFFEKHLLINN